MAAFEKRITADYGVDDTPESGEAADLIAQAQEFLAAARTYLTRS